MGKYNFDVTIDRRGLPTYKWDVKENELPMWVADMDFGTLPEVVNAIKSQADISAYGYSYCPKEYFEAYQGWWKRNHDVDLDPSWMTFSNGVIASLDSILKHILPKGSCVLIQVPVYHVFARCIANNGHTVLTNKLVFKNNDYQIDFKDLEEKLSLDNTKAMVFCNPHNPVGRIWTKEEIKKIADLCDKHNVLLISDEIHCDIVEPGYKYVPALSVTKNAITLLAPSKVFNMAAIHSSIVVCPNKELLNKIEDGLGKDDVGEPNYFASAATIAAFTNGDEWVKELNDYVYKNKKYIEKFLKEELPNITLVDSHATYMVWMNISYYTKDSENFANKLRKETGLFVSNGKQFGEGGETFLRINLATSLDNVKDACQRLKNFVKTL